MADSHEPDGALMKQWQMFSLCLILVAGFFAVLAYQMYLEVDTSLMQGALVTMTTAGVMYYFGTSRGSDRKTEIMSRDKGAE